MANPARQFDSLTYANKLRKAGVSEQQANLQAEALFTLVEEQLLNKQDLEKVELKLSGDIEKLDAKLSADIKEVKADLDRVEIKLSNNINEAELRLRGEIKDSELRLFVRLISAMAVIGGALKFLPNFHL